LTPLRCSAHARAGLLGNPSDGFFGKTISLEIRNFAASIVLEESSELEIVPGREDHCRFSGLDALAEDVRRNGLYGGMRLVKAAVKRFADYCQENTVALRKENFTLRYETDIPRQVGMAGSSAIITAVFRALMTFYEVEIPCQILPGLIMRVETEEIGIQAGLQDRVIQVYGGLVYMDFDRVQLEARGHGRYEQLDPDRLPRLYLAYRTDVGEDSGIYHSDLKARWDAGDAQVVGAMQEFGAITDRGRACLEARDWQGFSGLMDENFDLRQRISVLNPKHAEMVELARGLGVSAKFAGSGGAVVGVCEDDAVYARLVEEFGGIGCEVIRPE
jgi:glucuronokinase